MTAIDPGTGAFWAGGGDACGRPVARVPHDVAEFDSAAVSAAKD